jgi:hypothetical protein
VPDPLPVRPTTPASYARVDIFDTHEFVTRCLTRSDFLRYDRFMQKSWLVKTALIFVIVFSFANISHAGFVEACVRTLTRTPPPVVKVPAFDTLKNPYNHFFDDPKITEKVVLDYDEPAAGRTYNIFDEQTIRELNERYASVANEISLTQRNVEIETVIYPTSGHDAAAAFALFTNARVIIGIDAHPFVSNFDDVVTPLTKFNSIRGRSWTHYTEVGDSTDAREDEDRQVVRATIGLLKALNPKTRILKVFAFRDSDDKTHGQIDFDTGDGSSPKTYIHIQGAFTDDLRGETHWEHGWWGQKLLSSTKYEALLIKASMRLFGGNGATPGRETELVSKLGRDGGVLLDGDFDFDTFYDGAYPAQKVKFTGWPVYRIGYEKNDLYLLGPWASAPYVPNFRPARIQRRAVDSDRH